MVMVRLLLRAAVAPQAGELAKRPHLKTRAGKALAGLPTTRVTTRAVTRIAASTSLLLAAPTTTLRAAAVAAGALAADLLVALVALGIPALGVATCLGTKFGRL